MATLQKLPGVKFLGKPTFAHPGPQAALVKVPLARDALDLIYKKLPSDARQNMALAKRWGLFAVLATERWAYACARMAKPPKGEEEIAEQAEEVLA
jgi:hypothetical protein